MTNFIQLKKIMTVLILNKYSFKSLRFKKTSGHLGFLSKLVAAGKKRAKRGYERNMKLKIIKKLKLKKTNTESQMKAEIC